MQHVPDRTGGDDGELELALHLANCEWAVEPVRAGEHEQPRRAHGEERVGKSGEPACAGVSACRAAEGGDAGDFRESGGGAGERTQLDQYGAVERSGVRHAYAGAPGASDDDGHTMDGMEMRADAAFRIVFVFTLHKPVSPVEHGEYGGGLTAIR